MGRNQKRNKKVKLQTGSRNSIGQDEEWKNGEQWKWQEAISQDAAKFCRMRNFATCEILQVEKFSQPCKIPTVLQFPCIFYYSFLLVSDLQC